MTGYRLNASRLMRIIAIFTLGSLMVLAVSYTVIFVRVKSEINAPDAYFEVNSPSFGAESNYPEILPFSIGNESDLSGISSQGDGSSWETPFVIENFSVRVNKTDYITIENISSYVIIRNFKILGHVNLTLEGLIEIVNCSNMRIRNGTFQGTHLRGYGLKIRNSTNININDQNVFRDLYHGVSIYGSSHIEIRSAIFYNIARKNIWITDSSDLNFLSMLITTNGSYDFRSSVGMTCSSSTSVDVADSSYSNLSSGIGLGGSNSCRINNNTFGANIEYQLSLGSTQDSSVVGNRFSSPRYQQLKVTFSHNISVVSNLFNPTDTNVELLGVSDLLFEQNAFQACRRGHFTIDHLSSEKSNRIRLKGNSFRGISSQLVNKYYGIMGYIRPVFLSTIQNSFPLTGEMALFGLMNFLIFLFFIPFGLSVKKSRGNGKDFLSDVTSDAVDPQETSSSEESIENSPHNFAKEGAPADPRTLFPQNLNLFLFTFLIPYLSIVVKGSDFRSVPYNPLVGLTAIFISGILGFIIVYFSARSKLRKYESGGVMFGLECRQLAKRILIFSLLFAFIWYLANQLTWIFSTAGFTLLLLCCQLGYTYMIRPRSGKKTPSRFTFPAVLTMIFITELFFDLVLPGFKILALMFYVIFIFTVLNERSSE